MTVSEGIRVCLRYHRANSRKPTVKAYEFVLGKLDECFAEREIASLLSEEVLTFLNSICEKTKQRTKRTRFSYLRAFFNFIRNNIELDLKNRRVDGSSLNERKICTGGTVQAKLVSGVLRLLYQNLVSIRSWA